MRKLFASGHTVINEVEGTEVNTQTIKKQFALTNETVGSYRCDIILHLKRPDLKPRSKGCQDWLFRDFLSPSSEIQG